MFGYIEPDFVGEYIRLQRAEHEADKILNKEIINFCGLIMKHMEDAKKRIKTLEDALREQRKMNAELFKER